jgi:hypothetical protein
MYVYVRIVQSTNHAQKGRTEKKKLVLSTLNEKKKWKYERMN